MQKMFPPVTTTMYLQEREKWLKQLRRGESVSVVFFPKTDRFRRIHQTLEDKEFLKKFLGTKTRYLFQLTYLNVSLVEDRFDIQEHIARQLNLSNISPIPHSFEQWMTFLQKNNYRLVLILPDAERYLIAENSHILSLLLYLTLDYGPISVFSLYEADITHPSFQPVLSVSKDLYESIHFYPMYSSDDTLAFIQYLERKWEIKVPAREKERIVDYCGGHFWLVKEAVREIVDSGRWSIKSDSILFRIESIHNALLASDQSVLRKIVTKKSEVTQEELHSLTYLKTMRCLKPNGTLGIGLFKEYFQIHAQEAGEFVLRDDVLYLNRIPLQKMFPRKEYRVLRLFVEKKGEIVSRDDVAKTLWPTNTQSQYSDWAIDQIVSRIRKRFISLSQPTSLLSVVRGKGYKFL